MASSLDILHVQWKTLKMLLFLERVNSLTAPSWVTLLERHLGNDP